VLEVGFWIVEANTAIKEEANTIKAGNTAIKVESIIKIENNFVATTRKED